MKSFRIRLREKFQQSHNLPTLNPVVLLIDKALRDENTSAEAIGRIISEDMSMSANILRLANSAFYSTRGGPINTISGAVIKLGVREIGRLCKTLAVIKTFNKIGKHINHLQFWKHCIVTAYTAKTIVDYSEHVREYSDEEAYIAGLLHDVGTIVLDQYFTEESQRIWALAREKNIRNFEMEREILKMDHGEIGGYMLKRWKFPEPIVNAVSFHHQTDRVDIKDEKLVKVVHLADSICVGHSAEGERYGTLDDSSEKVRLELNLSDESMSLIIDNVKDEAARSEVILSLEGEFLAKT